MRRCTVCGNCHALAYVSCDICYAFHCDSPTPNECCVPIIGYSDDNRDYADDEVQGMLEAALQQELEIAVALSLGHDVDIEKALSFAPHNATSRPPPQYATPCPLPHYASLCPPKRRPTTTTSTSSSSSNPKKKLKKLLGYDSGDSGDCTKLREDHNQLKKDHATLKADHDELKTSTSNKITSLKTNHDEFKASTFNEIASLKATISSLHTRHNTF